MKVKKFEPNELDESEKHLIAPCGIYCGACDLFLGRSRHLAKELYRILNGFNMADVGPLAMGIERESGGLPGHTPELEPRQQVWRLFAGRRNPILPH